MMDGGGGEGWKWGQHPELEELPANPDARTAFKLRVVLSFFFLLFFFCVSGGLTSANYSYYGLTYL